MRAVLVLLVLGLSAWGLYLYLPTSEVGAEDREPDQPGVQFLDRPTTPDGGQGAAGSTGGGSPVGRGSGESGSAKEGSSKGAFGLSAQDLPSGAEEDVLLAQALVFGGPADVERALARLDVEEAQQRLSLSFAHAMTGDRKAGLQMAHGLDEPDALGAADRALLQAALTGQDAGAAARPASAGPEPLKRKAMRLRLVARDAERLLANGEHAQAAGCFSEVLLAALTGPWEAERASLVVWTKGLNAAQARHRWDPRGTWPSTEITVEDGDTLTHIRKRFLASHPEGMVCTGLIARANQVTGYIHPGDTLRVPTDRASTLVDLSSRWLLYKLGDEVAAAWEVGIGRDGNETITGVFRAADKQEEPTWFREGQDPQFFPDNPLGTRWIAWYRDGQKTGYGFHGTWEPETIGTAASDGCIRLRNDEAEVLFEILPVGARIEVQE